MRDNPAGSRLGAVATGLALAGLLLAAIALPAAWLRWESDAARDQAVSLAEAAASHAQAALQDLTSRFERASAALRAQDLQGDTVSLTARLLRAEPLVAPASGLVAINGRGQQVASSAIAAPPGGPVWWYQAVGSLARQPGLLGCGLGAPDGNGWMLARRIDGPDGSAAGFIGSFVAAGALGTLIAPAQGPVDYTLSDAGDCELLAGKAVPPEAAVQRVLVRLYRAVLPDWWVLPDPVVATITVGNLTWVGSIPAESILALRSAETRQHGVAVFFISAVFAALGLAIATVRRQSDKPGAEPGTAIDSVPPTEDASGQVQSKLEEMAGERDRILAAIGHDVRTPMNSVLGICALLLDGDLDESQRKWLQRIRASCQALLAMLNGMLEIAAARLDGAEINRESVDVAGLVEEAGEVLRPQAEDKGLELRVVIDDSVLGTWTTDSTRLRQVLFNLCGNAVKYTVHGWVEIGASVEHDQGRHLLRLRVTDTGPGIADDEREVIFEQFRRGRDEVAGGHEGLGLGLALCRDIASLLGGSLSLESAVEAGSAFTFTIPVERTEAAIASGGPLAGRCALVVGLSEGMRRRVASHLESLGFVVETAADGFLALGLAERIAFQHGALDLMVIDAALFGLSAEALMVRLKANHPHQRLRTVLVANGSLAATPEDEFDAMVAHPVEAHDLDRVLAAMFGDRSILQDIDPSAPAAPRARILVVEDNRINQALFVDQLTRAGFSTFAASNGREAIEAVQRGGFDAILMDVQMPELDGVEATRRIRDAEAGQRRIPIIGLTAHTGSILRRRCFRAGMDLVLHKPVDMATLPLRLREAMAGAQGFAESDPPLETAAGQAPSLDIDDDYLLVLIWDIGVERAGKCVNAFLADTPAHLGEMERLSAVDKWDELGQLAHSLAGISGTLGAVTFADGLLLLEDATRARESSRVAAALLDIHSTWERTRRTLRSRFAELSVERKGASRRAA